MFDYSFMAEWCLGMRSSACYALPPQESAASVRTRVLRSVGGYPTTRSRGIRTGTFRSEVSWRSCHRSFCNSSEKLRQSPPIRRYKTYMRRQNCKRMTMSDQSSTSSMARYGRRAVSASAAVGVSPQMGQSGAQVRARCLPRDGDFSARPNPR